MQSENAELLARITALEDPANQGESLDAVTWAQLIIGCIVIPAIVLIWGF